MEQEGKGLEIKGSSWHTSVWLLCGFPCMLSYRYTSQHPIAAGFRALQKRFGHDTSAATFCRNKELLMLLFTKKATLNVNH